jgi:hypothetical protein
MPWKLRTSGALLVLSRDTNCRQKNVGDKDDSRSTGGALLAESWKSERKKTAHASWLPGGKIKVDCCTHKNNLSERPGVLLNRDHGRTGSQGHGQITSTRTVPGGPLCGTHQSVLTLERPWAVPKKFVERDQDERLMPKTFEIKTELERIKSTQYNWAQEMKRTHTQQNWTENRSRDEIRPEKSCAQTKSKTSSDLKWTPQKNITTILHWDANKITSNLRTFDYWKEKWVLDTLLV